MKDDFEKVFGDKERIMLVFAHPDDAELYAGGTVARLIAAGKWVRIVKMTSGDRGSRDIKISERKLKSTREIEDTNSMNVLGIKPEDNVYLRIRDGEVDNSLETIGKVAYQIREFQPEIIITHNAENTLIRSDMSESWVNHRDHRNTGQSVLDALYPYSRDLLFFPEHFKNKKIKPGNCTEALLVDYYDHPDEVQFDITEFVETRVKAHACHASQYDQKAAQSSADFFTLAPDGRRRERFRYFVND